MMPRDFAIMFFLAFVWLAIASAVLHDDNSQARCERTFSAATCFETLNR